MTPTPTPPPAPAPAPARTPTPPAAAPVRRTFPTMGTVASVVVADPVPARDTACALDAVVAELERIEARFSAYRPHSEVSRYERGEVDDDAVSDELRLALDACTWLEQVSDGAFSARPPGGRRLDVAGYVKGWAIGRAGDVLREHGLRNWCVDVGGDVEAGGRRSDQRPWRVAVRDPDRPMRVAAVVEATDLAVATSGTYERGPHLWDTRTAAPSATAVRSFTVVGPEPAWADAFATAGWVKGLAGLDWVASFDGYGAMAVLADGRRPATAGFLAHATRR